MGRGHWCLRSTGAITRHGDLCWHRCFQRGFVAFKAGYPQKVPNRPNFLKHTLFLRLTVGPEIFRCAIVFADFEGQFRGFLNEDPNNA